MSELEQLKQRIIKANYEGLETSIIRDDYSPAGQLMINELCESGEFFSQRKPDETLYGINGGPWKVWASEFKPIF